MRVQDFKSSKQYYIKGSVWSWHCNLYIVVQLKQLYPECERRGWFEAQVLIDLRG